jgi:hypothetical protein
MFFAPKLPACFPEVFSNAGNLPRWVVRVRFVRLRRWKVTANQLCFIPIYLMR